MADGNIGHQTRISYKDDAGVWTPVKAAVKITPWKRSNTKTDFTNLESPNLAKEQEPGFGEYSDASVECNYVYNDATHGSILVDADSRTKREWKIEFRNPLTMAVEKTFTCLSGWVLDAGVGDLTSEGKRALTFSVVAGVAPTWS